MVIVGYEDRRSAFKIVNSWGTRWGIGGYGWIDYAASERLIRSAYVTTDAGTDPDPDNQPPLVESGETEWKLAMELPHFELTQDAAEFFEDPEGKPLTYEVVVEPAGIVEIPPASDMVFYLNPVTPGSAVITITAIDPGGLSASYPIEITVWPPGQSPPGPECPQGRDAC